MEAIIELWKLISAPIMGAFAWWNIMLHSGMEKNKSDLAEHRLHIAEHYAKKIDIDKIYEKIEKVEDGVNDIKNLLIKGKK